MNNEFDVKTFVNSLKIEITEIENEWSANNRAINAFDAQYPEENEPKYKGMGNVAPVMIDHSAGYVGVRFQDSKSDARDKAEITLLFSNRKDLSEVRMTYQALVNLSDAIGVVLNQYDKAKEAMTVHAEAVAEYQERKKERNKLREQVGSVASALWKRLKKQKKLVSSGSESERLAEEIPFD